MRIAMKRNWASGNACRMNVFIVCCFRRVRYVTMSSFIFNAVEWSSDADDSSIYLLTCWRIYYGYQSVCRERSRAFSINVVHLSKYTTRVRVRVPIVEATYHSTKKPSRKWSSAVLPPTVSIRLFAMTIRSSRLSFCRSYRSLRRSCY